MNLDSIHIIKNNGDREIFDAEKIHKHLHFACQNLDVDSISIIKDARLKIFDGAKSVDIQDSLIKSAQEKISEDSPDYELVAGRLLNQKLRKEVFNQYSPLDFKSQVKERIKKGFYTEDLNAYSDEELDYFGSLINYELDNELPYSALNQMYSKYLIKHNKKCIEVPQEVFILIPMAIFYNTDVEYRKKYIKLGYELLSQRKISLPTPIMNGARTSYKKFISCNLLNFGDSVESFARGLEAILKCTSAKSGLGVNTSFIRGLGAPVGKPSRMAHTGMLPIVKAIESATSALVQIGRGGSSNLTMPFFHYEIELFSQLGDSKGSLENRARHTDQTIIINKWFLEKALNKEDIFLFHMSVVGNPDTKLDLYDALGDYKRFDELYNYYSTKVSNKNKKKINAYDLLSLIINERMITGRVYIVFADNFVNSSFKENLYMTNLCCEISVPSHSLDNYKGISGELGTCILGNINFGHSKESDIPKAADFLVRFLDNMINISDFAMPEIEYSATKRRTLGIGVSNLFGYLAKAKLFYNTKEAREHISDLMELFYYNLVKTSIELAKERGACELYNESYYSNNKFIFERYLEAGIKPEFKPKLDWESLRENLSKYGMRHSSLSAVPPAGNCISEDHTIETYEGNFNLKDICNRESIDYNDLKPGWYDLKSPLKVPTFEGDSISNRFYYNGEVDVIEIETDSGVIEVTANHELLVERNGNNIWVAASLLEPGDSIICKN